MEQHESTVDIVFTVEDVDCAIRSLKNNQAVGPDGLSSEHLLYAGGRLIVLLTTLFNSCLVHGFVPESFATSLIVPVSKGHASKLHVFEGYRPVSLVNVILKVFEMSLLNVLNRFIINDELQFGFSAEKGCQKALLMFSTVINYFNDRGSNVYIAGLDVAKAFDSVNYYEIFIKLMNVHVPLCVLNTLVN